MEDLGLRALYRRVAGIDVHRMLLVATVLIEQPDGRVQRQTREFGGFRRDCRALAAWLTDLGVELVVMESTGIYWKSVHAHLENAGIAAWVVNAHMIKHVPGRKTDMADSEWLAVLRASVWCGRALSRPRTVSGQPSHLEQPMDSGQHGVHLCLRWTPCEYDHPIRWTADRVW
ncbi:MAG: transposase [Rubrivivax sp.]|nr:transposase [Rubrivivax sp.]